ncbi:Ribonuclease H-like domain [Cinara cedri]|uniref:Ribonuclease H-like domain n=1 Tax=Cinara cedri TaxID=506608 RepID=A0A5E4NA76_9HEMI|nr:Ribonuclease H-like domain [Cinara cedri]
MDVIDQDIKNVEESSFDDAYDREKWRGVVMAAMALNGPISFDLEKENYFNTMNNTIAGYCPLKFILPNPEDEIIQINQECFEYKIEDSNFTKYSILFGYRWPTQKDIETGKTFFTKIAEKTPKLNNLDEKQKEKQMFIEDLEDNVKKVRDHNHLTGKYRGAAHSICNLNYKVPRFIPLFFHNLSEKLANNLKPNQFKKLSKHFPEKLVVVKGKLAYPYKYMDSPEKYNEESLPNIDKFYSFLTDIMENYRHVSLKHFKLDPVHYYTTPGFAWNAMLRKTGIELELITDIDI